MACKACTTPIAHGVGSYKRAIIWASAGLRLKETKWRCPAELDDAGIQREVAEHDHHKPADGGECVGLLLDAAKFARRVRRRLGFSQIEFAERIDVSLDTIRNWEQGKRCPTGAAKALLKVLDKAPEAALAALH
jgi:putative transcriptional regulator